MPKPLILDSPYPAYSDLSGDAFSLNIISPAYASSESELNTVLQYLYHSYFFEREGYGEIHDTLISIAVAEMMHLNLLGKTILALGAQPFFTRFPSCAFDFYSAKYVSYSQSLANMLEDDIIGERRAVSSYNKMLLRLKNPKVAEIVSRVCEDEKLHLKTLQNLYNEFIR